MGEKEKKVLCIGGTNFDYKFRLIGKLLSNTSNPINTKISYGGVARNVAENLGRLGLDVSLLTLVGRDDPGEEIIKHAKNYLNVDLIEMTDSERTGSYYAVVDHNGEMKVAYADMSICEGMDSQWLAKYLKKMREYQYIIADMNLKKSALESLLNWNKIHNKFIAIIGVSSPKMDNLSRDLKDIDLIICNKDESESYFKIKRTSQELCEMWLNKGVRKVIITSGSKEIVYADGLDNIQSMAVKKIKKSEIVNVTGAGDAFSAGVVFGLVENKDFKLAVKLGAANASKTILSDSSVREDLNMNKLLEEAESYGRD